MNMKPLVSVILLTYKNKEYIFETLKSILIQDCSNFELIISNDGDPEFDETRIRGFIKVNSSVNLKCLIINNNQTNKGTVRNANIAVSLANGYYIKFIAADDTFYDEQSLSSFLNFMDTFKSNWAVSKYLVYDYNLENMLYTKPSNKYIELLRSKNVKNIFRYLTIENFIGGISIMLRRDFFNEMGGFDEKYELTEDWPTWIRYSLSGYKIDYFDKVTMKYRLGGISNSSSTENIGNRIKLNSDLKTMYEKEIMPNFKSIPYSNRRFVEYSYRKIKDEFNFTRLSSFTFRLEYFDVICIKILNKFKNWQEYRK